jgi:3-hexulose-6-phosphate synthase
MKIVYLHQYFNTPDTTGSTRSFEMARRWVEAGHEVHAAIAQHVDWIEVGTSLIKAYGMDGVRAVVEAAAGVPVLADLKTADDARFEFTLAYDAGAASATVLGLAADATLDTAVRVAAEREREAVVDLMGLVEHRRAELAARLPAEVVLAAHVGKDVQTTGLRPESLLGPWADGRRLALAGGLTAADLRQLGQFADLRVIVGSAVTKADDPLTAVFALRAAAAQPDNIDKEKCS